MAEGEDFSRSKFFWRVYFGTISLDLNIIESVEDGEIVGILMNQSDSRTMYFKLS